MKYWNGSAGGINPRGASDYVRACAVSDEIDVIFVNDTPALVLGDEPDRTALVVRSPLDVIFIRWRWAVSEESMISALEAVDLRDLALSNGIFRAISDNYELFDSAYSGSSVIKSLSAQLKDRTYSIESAESRPDKKDICTTSSSLFRWWGLTCGQGDRVLCGIRSWRAGRVAVPERQRSGGIGWG